jgi:hypothetical protein
MSSRFTSGAGREVPEHPAPGRADREAGASQQRREGRRLDAEVAEDADDKRDVQDHADHRTEVLDQHRVDGTAVHGRPHAGRDAPDQPAADQPECERGQDLEGDRRHRGGQQRLDRV